MSRILSIIFLTILSVSISKRAGLNEDCSAFKWCEHGLACINYRCVVATEDHLQEKLEYAPKGPKCAPEKAKYCPKNYFCENHRCYSAYLNHPMYDPNVPEYFILKKVLEEETRETTYQQQPKTQANQPVSQA